MPPRDTLEGRLSSLQDEYDTTSNRPPVSLGPGGRPTTQTQTRRASNDIIKELLEVRSHYKWTVSDSALGLGYKIRGIAREYTIPFERVPIGPFMRTILYGGQKRRVISSTLVIDVLRGAENIVERPLTQSEAEGYTFHASKKMMYGFAANASALTIGSALAWKGRESMKFPFRPPKPIERYDNFPGKPLPLITGKPARIMWHITRTNMYFLVGMLILNPLLRTMGDNSMMVGLYRDNRTHNVLLTIREVLKQRGIRGGPDRISSNLDQGGSYKPQAQVGDDDYQSSDPEGYYKDSPDSPPSDYSGAHDYNAGGDSAFAGEKFDTAILSDSQMHDRGSGQPSPSSFSERSKSQRNPVQQQQQQQQHDYDSSSSSDFIFDSALPVAGSSSDGNVSAQTSRRGGSAWDRIRRGVLQSPRSTSESQTGTDNGLSSSMDSGQSATAAGFRKGEAQGSDPYQTSGDSFSFSKSDEERQLAKAQAQKEFDRMLDEERRGCGDGDGFTSGFGAGGGDGLTVWEKRRRGN